MLTRHTNKLLYIFVGILVLAVASYAVAYWRANNQERIVTFYSDSYLSAPTNPSQNVVAPGSSFVAHLHILRQPYTCWAEYYPTLRGTISYTYPATGSWELPEKAKEIRVNLLYEIPKGLPAGSYRLEYTVYPHCLGFDLTPFKSEVKLEIEIRP